MELALKALLGAAVVIVIQLLALTRNYYLAGLAPLFPTFALIAHYIVGTERTVAELKSTIVFGGFSLVPYLVYLVTLYFLVDRHRLGVALAGATFSWTAAAAVLIYVWSKL
ncbi:MAG: GlpM family protein [Planctomycetota bacterium]